MHPAISGMTIVWEDYRHGLGNIYTYDLVSRTEKRYSVSAYNQTYPAISGSALAWTDQRNSQRDIYFSPAQYNEARVTFGTGDHSQAAMLDNVIVYTDYEAGLGDSNLSFYDTGSSLGALLTANPAKQDEPYLGSGVLLWQDDRDGVSQIYWSNFQVEAVPISADLKPGLNLIAVGDRLTQAYPTSTSLIASAPNGIVVEKIVAYNSLNSIYLDSSTGSEISLARGMAIGLYATIGGELELADSGESTQYTLLPGAN
jgi:beta propeller repeat protein